MVERPPILVLASASSIRRQLLANAGLSFDLDPAEIDEPTAAAAVANLPVPERARGLAETKALTVAARRPKDLVIGADQMLELQGEVLFKSADRLAARQTLLRLRGRTHRLHSGVALASGPRILWSTVETASLHMRAFSDAALDAYIDMAGDALTKSVGAYQLEGAGVQLFERIEGDYFTILGLPLLLLLAELRRVGALKD